MTRMIGSQVNYNDKGEAAITWNFVEENFQGCKPPGRGSDADNSGFRFPCSPVAGACCNRSLKEFSAVIEPAQIYTQIGWAIEVTNRLPLESE